MALAITCWPVIVKAHLPFEGTPCESFGGKMAPRQNPPPARVLLLCHIRIIPVLLHTHSFVFHRTYTIITTDVTNFKKYE